MVGDDPGEFVDAANDGAVVVEVVDVVEVVVVAGGGRVDDVVSKGTGGAGTT